MRNFGLKAVLFINLNILDAIFTGGALSKDAIEIMPVSSWILNNFGYNAFFTAKIVFACFVLLLIYVFRRPRILNMLNAVMAAVCVVGLFSLIYLSC